MKVITHKEYVVYCNDCTEMDFIHDSDEAYRATDTPARFFRRYGWRGEGGQTYCPVCAVKRGLSKHDYNCRNWEAAEAAAKGAQK